MNGREKEYCYQTEREGECCGGGEKNDFKFKVSSRFPVAPHETLSPPSEPPHQPLPIYIHTLSPFRTIYMQRVFNGCCGLMQMCLFCGFVFAPQDIIIRTQVSGCNKLIRQ